MNPTKFYTLPDLPYDYKALEPFISEEQLRIHHQKHHQAYVTGTNALFEKIDKAREEDADLDFKAIAKELSFNIGGYMLHSLFWLNLSPVAKKESFASEGEFAKAINEEFGNFERLKKEFSKVALSIEGSGWAALTLCPETKRLVLMQIEKHNTNLYPSFPILLIVDMFEHAYYIDYKNEKSKFVDAFWNIVNLKQAEIRFKKALG